MDMTNVQPLFEPDPVQMRRHVGHLFEGWLDGCHEGRIELAWTDARDGKLRHAAIFGTDGLDELVGRAVVENRRPGQNVYIGQALRQPDIAPFGRCGDDEVFALTAFYVDIDDDVTATASINYRNRGCPPTGVVVTGRHPHVRAQMLWRLEAPLRDLELCRQQNAALAQALNGDPSVVNPSRVMRLGGSIAWPIKEGRVIERTEFLDFDDGRPKVYMPEQIARAFPAAQAVLSPPTGEGVSPPSKTPSTTPTLQIGTSTLSVDACIAAIRAGDHWHDNMLRLVGHWISRGMTDEEILSLASTFTLAGYTVADTRRETEQMLSGGRRKWNMPNPEHKVEAEPNPEALRPAFLEHLNVAMLPSRQWLLGRALIRGHLTVLVAPAGVGKSTHGIARAIALATGQEITGEGVHEQVRVWVYNIEDDRIELKRRLAAALQHHAIGFDEVKGRVALNSGADQPLLMARLDKQGTVIRQPDVKSCIAHIKRENIGLFVVDPFVETHEVNENSNEHIKSVAAMYREIAREANCAVLLVHHTSKPPQGASDSHAGNMNTARGASALVGVARVVQTLFSMSDADAEQYGVAKDERHLFLRLDDAKANLGLISGAAAWYRRHSVTIANGDEVGVMVPHQFDGGTAPDITPDKTRQVFEEIERRWDAGEPFSSRPNSDRHILPWLEKQGLRKRVARSVLSDWLTNQMLRSETYDAKTKGKGLKVIKWPG